MGEQSGDVNPDAQDAQQLRGRGRCDGDKARGVGSLQTPRPDSDVADAKSVNGERGDCESCPYPNTDDTATSRQREYGREILQDSESTRPYGSGVNDTHSNLTGLEIGESIGGHDGTELSPSFRGDWNKSWIEVATALCGVDDGFPNRVARLKALGNACVPQQVYPTIYRAIAGIERNGAKVKKIQGMQKEMDVRV